MRCPTCGSPAMIRNSGHSWECGWCGDSGMLYTPAAKNTASALQSIELTFSVVYHIDLAETYRDLQKELKPLSRGNAGFISQIGRVMVYTAAVGIAQLSGSLDTQKKQELQAFLNGHRELGKLSADDVIRAGKHGDFPFAAESTLSDDQCGTFWNALMKYLPHREFGREPDVVMFLTWEFGHIYGYFSGKELAGAQEYRWELEDAISEHWNRYVVYHPDEQLAREMLSKGVLHDGIDHCQALLVKECLVITEKYSYEDMATFTWEDEVEKLLDADPPLAIAMWRTLLDAAEPCLSKDEDAASELLPNFIQRQWLYDEDAFHLEPILNALKDERFAAQVFQSACVDSLQLDVLRACNHMDRMELGQHLLELLKASPLPQKEWRMSIDDYERGLTVGLARPKAKRMPNAPIPSSLPDDGTIYNYCTVKVGTSPRLYSYLTGGLELTPGDWIEVPWGKNNTVRTGQVASVMSCTRSSAPWPPEQAKTVLGKTEAPKVSAPKPKEEKTVTVESPHTKDSPTEKPKLILKQAPVIAKPKVESQEGEQTILPKVESVSVPTDTPKSILVQERTTPVQPVSPQGTDVVYLSLNMH